MMNRDSSSSLVSPTFEGDRSLRLHNNMRHKAPTTSNTKGVNTVIKVGFYCDIFSPNRTVFYLDHLQAFAAFKMAVDEINNSSNILPHAKLVVAMRRGSGSYEAILAALSLGTANFTTESFGGVGTDMFIGSSTQGVDVVVNTGDNDETMAASMVFANSYTVQLHTSGELF
jgi:hypothetical protein